MNIDRYLNWEGCFNTRDLGGFRTADDRETCWKAIVRSDSPDRLTTAGWSALQAYGIRTIVDLRHDAERQSGATRRPAGLTTVHVPLEDLADAEFWQYWGQGLNCTPLYYRPFLDRNPERCAAAITAIAHARPGGVLVHCGVGRDRTGLIALLLLALVGVAPDDIATDYELSTDRLRPLFAQLRENDQDIEIQELLRRQNTTARTTIRDTLASLDVNAYLRAGGLSDNHLAVVRARLLGR